MNRDEGTVSNQVLNELKRYIEDLLSFFGLRAAVKISTGYSVIGITTDPKSIQISIADSDLSRLLVGHNGTNLSALQHIVNSFSKSRWPDLGLIIHVDIGEYRSRQVKKLIEMVESRANEVIATSELKELSGLNSQERRIVHEYISENYSGKLITESSGQGSERQLFIKTVN